MKTPAAILTELQQPLELDEVEIPALDVGQTLVRIHASRICGSQIGEIDGVKGPDNWLPHLLGHEAGGVVEEVGSGVTRVKPGDHVVLHWRPSEGIQCRPPCYRRGNQTVNAGWITTFNHRGVISENRLTKVAPDTDMELRCLMADTLTTGFGIVNRDAGVQLGESVAVVGAGGIGSGVILGAHLAGANPLIAVDLFDHKLEHARKLGATHTINGREGDFVEQVREIVGAAGADVVIDGTGNPEIIAKCYSLTKGCGRCVLFGVPHHTKNVSLHTLPLHFGRVLTGSEGGQSLPHSDIPKYLDLLRARGADLSGMVTHRGSLEDVNDLIPKMRSGEVIHAVMHYPAD